MNYYVKKLKKEEVNSNKKKTKLKKQRDKYRLRYLILQYE
jgi:hypothetical protein